MNINKIVNDPRMIKALTSLSYQEFYDLVPEFERQLYIVRKQKPNRKRLPGQGQKGVLNTTEAKLFFVLFYVKTYPTFDVLSFVSGKQRGHACEATHFLLRVLEKTLGHKIRFPKRKIRSIEEFIEVFPDIKDVFLDGTERRIQRPKKKKNQTKQYSGKKKTTTRKNVILASERGEILYMIEHIPKSVGIWTDTGFKGIESKHPNVCMPKKGSKLKPLTLEEKRENTLISSIRVKAEHAIGGMKRFRSMIDTLRNRLGVFDDQIIGVPAGLWNYHLSYRT
jgi:DDE superfamily endonuclease